ncbi:uncharacterized protein LOC115751604 [Rhodamnia argentea]|uniref:Uncharacterized protein LOC115751604 n=1 Tax=Rhodamnia argentea TaxID=178133 RepID=A0ABM3H3E1_9MYRT|nr:uncharacterized protein LOC115751604 [Rhodamnia argentea]
MEVMIPPSMEFDFNSSRSSPHASAPSTPKRFGEYYFSAPNSPARVADFYREFDEFSAKNLSDPSPSSSCSAAVPFVWEEKPGTPKSPQPKAFGREPVDFKDDGDDGFNFAFDLSKDSDRHSLSAEELFDGGRIRPLKHPPRLQSDRSARTPPKSPLAPSPKAQRSQARGLFSPRARKESDPSEAATENARRSAEPRQARGRERLQRSDSGRRAARSLSPYRVSAYPWEEEEKQPTKQTPTSKPPCLTGPSASAASKGSSKKWSLKDFLLFRSASEGRATDKDPFRKYAASFRSIDSPTGPASRRRGPVSAHELHYTVNKAVSNDLKKKTFLPYKQGILGRLAFNPAVHGLANGFGSLYRQ